MKLFLPAVVFSCLTLSACPQASTPAVVEAPDVSAPPSGSIQCDLAQAKLTKLHCLASTSPSSSASAYLGDKNNAGIAWNDICHQTFTFSYADANARMSPLHPDCILQAQSCEEVRKCQNP